MSFLRAALRGGRSMVHASSRARRAAKTWARNLARDRNRLFACAVSAAAVAVAMPEIEPPSAQQVQAYLAAYQIESVVEEAINDAVLKQVKDPFGHISQLLMNHSLKTAGSTTDRKNSRRVSLGGVPLMSHERRVSLSMETYQQTQQKKEMIKIAPGEDDAERASKAGPLTGEELERAMPKKEVQASEELTGKLKAFFTKMDFDGDGSVTKEEAIKFWGKNFAKVNAQSMFNEVDEDGDGSVTWDEFFAFWKNVLGSGYSEEDLIEEVDMMMEGGAWVDFDDGRTT